MSSSFGQLTRAICDFILRAATLSGYAESVRELKPWVIDSYESRPNQTIERYLGLLATVLEKRPLK
jgi:hypothetical protein